MLKIGLVGCGGMGTTHSMAYQMLAGDMDIQVSAIADVRAPFLERAKEQWPEAQCFADAFDLIEKSDVDIIDICLPSYMHASAAKAAMRKGRHVFIEKPVCLKEEDCQMLLEEREKSGVKVMVGHVVRYFKEYDFLKQVTDDMRFGKLKFLNLQRLSPDPTWGFEDWFHDNDKSGFVVMDLHVHDMDYLRYLLGEPDEVRLMGASTFANGLINHIITSYRFGETLAMAEGIFDETSCWKFRATYRACFEKATVELADGKVMIYERNRDGQSGKAYEHIFEEVSLHSDKAGINITDQGPYAAELRDFLTCIIEDKPITKAPLEEGIASVRLGFQEWQLARDYCSGAKTYPEELWNSIE